ncbi:WD repeat-containing protein 37 [Cichlidogyrus casuarinus]|uniref:WD repeat-containing protein 37 n=1 Tax=Cichlidogyrus casuarinus TaxID=1844966 RepID=A0ABD2Q1K5_9PLAT
MLTESKFSQGREKVGPSEQHNEPTVTIFDHEQFETESFLPREFRIRLKKQFAKIEQDFEREYRKLYLLNLESAVQISQRIKQQYKQSTSKLVSSFRSNTHSNSNTASFPSAPSSDGGRVLSELISTLNSSSVKLPTGVFGPGFIHYAASKGFEKPALKLVGHRDGIWEISAFKNFLASCSADCTLRLWANDDSALCYLMYAGHGGSVNSVRFREQDNLMLTASGDGSAHLIKLPFQALATAQLNQKAKNGKFNQAMEQAASSLLGKLAHKKSTLIRISPAQREFFPFPSQIWPRR